MKMSDLIPGTVIAVNDRVFKVIGGDGYIEGRGWNHEPTPHTTIWLRGGPRRRVYMLRGTPDHGRVLYMAQCGGDPVTEGPVSILNI